MSILKSEMLFIFKGSLKFFVFFFNIFTSTGSPAGQALNCITLIACTAPPPCGTSFISIQC